MWWFDVKRFTGRLVLAAATVLAAGSLSFGVDLQIQIQLGPGEGTILLIGNGQDYAEVADQYFSAQSSPPPGVLDRLLLGFYTSGSASDAEMTLYEAIGCTAVYGYVSMNGSSATDFATRAAAHGLLAICQPNDLYFNEPSPAYQTMENYRDWVLIPNLQSYAPPHVNDTNIFAWAPREELSGDEADPIKPDEANFTAYKAAFKTELPNHLLFQLDSQQRDEYAMRFKRQPMPDISGFDRYPWWWRYDHNWNHLWTPDYALSWLFGEIDDYPPGSFHVMNAPAVFVAQGCAEMRFLTQSQGESLYGWMAQPGWRHPTAPCVSWEPQVSKFALWNRYLAPTNAWRCQGWVAICAGFKGLMYWSGIGGGDHDPAYWDAVFNNGEGTYRNCLIDSKLDCLEYVNEISASWIEMRRMENLILDIRPEPISQSYSISDSKVVSNTFLDSSGREYIVVVNRHIGTWLDENDNPTNPDPVHWQSDVDDLYVNRTGQLVNFTPATGGRTITITLNDSGSNWLYDLRQLAQAPQQCGDPGTVYLEADLNKDCYVDWSDFSLFAGQWLSGGCTAPDWCGGTDLDQDGQVNWADFSIFGSQWLECTDPANSECSQ